MSDAGDTHPCDGLNSGANSQPYNTALDALDEASKVPNTGFTYSLGYDGDLSDFYVVSLAGYSSETWGLLYNWKVPDYGDGLTIAGCRQEVQTNDNLLWAYGVSQTSVFLKVIPSAATIGKGASITFTITDGLTGKVQPGATIHGVKANIKGEVVVNYGTTGYFTFKAKQTGAVRSELVKVTVSN